MTASTIGVVAGVTAAVASAWIHNWLAVLGFVSAAIWASNCFLNDLREVPPPPSPFYFTPPRYDKVAEEGFRKLDELAASPDMASKEGKE